MDNKTLRLDIGGAPALVVFRGDVERAARCGTVLYYHGFGGSKEDTRTALDALAATGFLAIGLDSVGHGERRQPELWRRIESLGPGSALETEFLTLVRATAQEIPAILDVLVVQKLAAQRRVGVAGWSMGGFVTYAAAVSEPRLQAAVAMLGSPAWRLPWPESPHRHPQRCFPLALLSQTAGADRRVPPDAARRFHTALTASYRDTTERLGYVEYPGIGHDAPEGTADTMRERMVAWFNQYLT